MKKLHKVTVRLEDDVWTKLQVLVAQAKQKERRSVSANEAVVRLIRGAKHLQEAT